MKDKELLHRLQLSLFFLPFLVICFFMAIRAIDVEHISGHIMFWVMSTCSTYFLFKLVWPLLTYFVVIVFGKLSIGIIVEVRDSGVYVNGNPELEADVVCVDTNDNPIHNHPFAGMGRSNYRVGTFVELQYLKKWSRIVRELDTVDISSDIAEHLCRLSEEFFVKDDEENDVEEWE